MVTTSLEIVRTNHYEREAFLNRLLKHNSARIFRAVVAHVRPGNQMFVDLLNCEAPQAFLLGANAALDKFIETDDGRGKNDFAGFCSWSGLNAVHTAVRDAARLARKQSHYCPIDPYEMTGNARGAHGTFDHVGTVIKIEDPVRDILSVDAIESFMQRVKRQEDRVIVGLLLSGHGPAPRNRPSYETPPRRNYLRELEMASGFSESTILASIKRLRKVASEHFA